MPVAHANGIEIDYDVFGTGEPLLLVMGIASQGVLWDARICERLAARGFSVIRYDHRDVGRSTWFEDAPTPDPVVATLRGMLRVPVAAPYTLSDMARDAVGLLDALGHTSAHVVGASMGGMIAQHMAIEHPSRVRSLTLAMTTPGNWRYMPTNPRVLRGFLGRVARTREESMDSIERLFRVIGGSLPIDFPALREAVGHAWDRGHNPHAFARHWAAVIASGSRARRLGALRLPTLVVHGAEDPLVPARAGRALARLIPGARLLEIEEMGHWMPAVVWPRVLDEIEALARREGPPTA